MVRGKTVGGKEEQFFRKVFERHGSKVNSFLDCACGTGHHVAVFEKGMGLEASGSDASEAMVEKAEKLAEKEGLDSDFKVVDFRNLSQRYPENSFDAVICIGNSLPHLKTDEDLREAISEMKAVLRDGGLLVIGQRNYDLLRDEEKRFLPVSIGDEEVFFYVLDHHEETITFNVVDIEIESGDFEVYSTEYNALRKKHLEKLLAGEGMEVLQFYGDGELKDFEIGEDETFTVVCRK